MRYIWICFFMNVRYTQILCGKKISFEIRLFDKAYKDSIHNVSTNDMN